MHTYHPTQFFHTYVNTQKKWVFVSTKTPPRINTEFLLKITPNYKFRCLWIEEWINLLWYIHTMEYYTSNNIAWDTTETHNKMDRSHKYYIEQVKPVIAEYILGFLLIWNSRAGKKKKKMYGNRSQHSRDLFRKSTEWEDVQGPVGCF